MTHEERVNRMMEAIAGHFRQCEIDVWGDGEQLFLDMQDSRGRNINVYLYALADTVVNIQGDV